MKTAHSVLLFFFLTFFSFFVTPAYAQVSSYTPQEIQPSSLQQDKMHTTVQGILSEVVSFTSCQISGVDIVQTIRPCIGVYSSAVIGMSAPRGGAIGAMGYLIGQEFRLPIHTTDYIAYMGSHFGIAKPVYAASGIDSISPLIGIWSAFRNITYLLFVLVFIIIGFAIMLRVRLDPHTVISIENQLPRIVIGLLLVTFSFAIAGLLIDFMWVAIYLTITILATADSTNLAANGFWGNSSSHINVPLLYKNLSEPPVNFLNEFYKTQPSNSPGGVLEVVGRSASAVQHIMSSLFSQTITWAGGTPAKMPGCDWWNVGCHVGNFFSDIGGNLSTFLFGWILSYFVSILAFLIIMFAVLLALFRLWFTLLKSYVFILIDIALSPFFIVLGLIPGSPVSFEIWLRDMLGHLLAFPIAIGMFMMGKVFFDQFTISNHAIGLFVPPLIGNPNGDGNLEPLGKFIALGIILMTPQVVAMAQDLVHAPQFKYAASVSQHLAAGGQTPGRIAGGIFYQKNPAQHHVKPGLGGSLANFLRGAGVWNH